MNPSPQQIAEIAAKQDEKAKAIRAVKVDEANRSENEVEAARVIQVNRPPPMCSCTSHST